MAFEFYLGIDVVDDQPATLTLVEKEDDGASGDTDDDIYHVREVRQLEEEKGAEAAAEFVQSLIAEDPYLGRTIIVVNCSSRSGADLQEELQERGMSPEGVIVTGGEDSEQQGISGLDTPNTENERLVETERNLVSTLDRLYHEDRLELPQENTEEVSKIAQGLQDYRIPAGNDNGEGYRPDISDEKRSAAHANFVISAALACWLAEEHEFDASVHLGGEAPTTGPAKHERQ